MTDYEDKWKEYRNRAIQALGTKYLLYAQCGLVDIFGCVGMIHCYHYYDKWKEKKKNGNDKNK